MKKSITQDLANKCKNEEKIYSSYSGVVIDKNKMLATISVSIDGKDIIIESDINQIGFDIYPDMKLIVDCVKRGGVKQLSFRPSEIYPLDEEEKELAKLL